MTDIANWSSLIRRENIPLVEVNPRELYGYVMLPLNEYLMENLLEQTAQNFRITEVSVDKSYSSYKNLRMIEGTGAQPFIPFRSNDFLYKRPLLCKAAYRVLSESRKEILTHIALSI